MGQKRDATLSSLLWRAAVLTREGQRARAAFAGHGLELGSGNFAIFLVTVALMRSMRALVLIVLCVGVVRICCGHLLEPAS